MCKASVKQDYGNIQFVPKEFINKITITFDDEVIKVAPILPILSKDTIIKIIFTDLGIKNKPNKGIVQEDNGAFYQKIFTNEILFIH